MISFEAIPDIVSAELLVEPDDLRGWEPMVIDIDAGRLSRIRAGLITPKEMALQIAFGNKRHGYYGEDDLGYAEQFDRARKMADRSDAAPGSHEAGYVAVLALWHERNVVLDYINSWRSYSSVFDGHNREGLNFVDPEVVTAELHSRIVEYVTYVESGCLSKQEALDMRGREYAESQVALGVAGLRKIFLAESSRALRAMDAERVFNDYASVVARDDARLARIASARK